MKPIFIIEHLEPRIWKWCLYEYEHISQIVGKENLWITNVRRGSSRLGKFGKVFRESVKEMKLEGVCVLDPEARESLTSEDSGKFRYFVFGGILGDYPPRKRTKKELTKFLPDAGVRNIGKKQFG